VKGASVFTFVGDEAHRSLRLEFEGLITKTKFEIASTHRPLPTRVGDSQCIQNAANGRGERPP